MKIKELLKLKKFQDNENFLWYDLRYGINIDSQKYHNIENFYKKVNNSKINVHDLKNRISSRLIQCDWFIEDMIKNNENVEQELNKKLKYIYLLELINNGELNG